MFNVQLCLIFERVPVTLKFLLHGAIVIIVQKNIALMVMDTTPIKY